MRTDEAFLKLESSPRGLANEEAKKRIEMYGPNQLEEKNRVTPFKVFIRQFANVIVWVLAAAAIIALVADEVINFWAIIGIILFVILMGFLQEYRAEKAMEALKKFVQPIIRVRREGTLKEIPSKDVVPGDILVLESGDMIPADALVIEMIGLRVEEAALTGESVPVNKEKDEMIFAGTQIVHGKCSALVVSTGMKTKLGEIAGLVQQEEETTPLQEKITKLARTLAAIALIASLVTLATGLFKGAPMTDMLLIAIALAVAAVPEGLPLTMTITLANGMRHMAQHNAIVRKMLGVETLGSTTVICTDKTGTLTRNEMTVRKIVLPGSELDVTGMGYEPIGELLNGNTPADIENEKGLEMLLRAGALCNNAALEESNNEWKGIGDPTEIALVVAAAKAGIWKRKLDDELPRLQEVIFTSERKMMSTLHNIQEQEMTFTKGAPEIVLERCTRIYDPSGVRALTEHDREEMLDKNHELAQKTYRVLALAYRPLSEKGDELEKDMIFLGLVAMLDPPREEAKKAIETCHKAGIKVVMITGDNQETAKAIAMDIGLSDGIVSLDGITDEKVRSILDDGAITGSELDGLNDEEFSSVVEKANIYARARPEQKLRIVKALQDRGHVVAMTGDGVNDAPALRKADIGISMGIKGTDVSREASVMVLQDDNFATIVEAVKMGRGIYANIEKFTTYLVSRNFTEMILILITIAILGFEYIPLLALQILFINMFSEIVPAISLGMDPVREGIMRIKPRNPKEEILGRRNLTLVISTALTMSIVSFLVFMLADPFTDVQKARTLTFVTIVCMALFVPNAFRSLDESVIKMGLYSNKLMLKGMLITFLLILCVVYIPLFQVVFELTPLTAIDWVLPLGAAFLTLLIVEGIKFVVRKEKKRVDVRNNK
ncbi:cation-transporting P-type ATPase [uncultured Methanomethylovorans sp.]|uniref:cation-translocating P-type ATPase n=1 Tax=uncultured Methanomethylovorans sp. TaxID=183759 RepID=UPI002AA6EAA4|nr:cation-transporting P-type ATPase [uncultured Methanomethylovorans sp.]